MRACRRRLVAFWQRFEYPVKRDYEPLHPPRPAFRPCAFAHDVAQFCQWPHGPHLKPRVLVHARPLPRRRSRSATVSAARVRALRPRDGTEERVSGGGDAASIINKYHKNMLKIMHASSELQTLSSVA